MSVRQKSIEGWMCVCDKVMAFHEFFTNKFPTLAKLCEYNVVDFL